MENKKVLSAVKKVRKALTVIRGLDGSGGSQLERDEAASHLNEAIVSFKEEGIDPDVVEQYQEGEQPGVEQHNAPLDPAISAGMQAAPDAPDAPKADSKEKPPLKVVKGNDKPAKKGVAQINKNAPAKGKRK